MGLPLASYLAGLGALGGLVGAIVAAIGAAIAAAVAAILGLILLSILVFWGFSGVVTGLQVVQLGFLVGEEADEEEKKKRRIPAWATAAVRGCSSTVGLVFGVPAIFLGRFLVVTTTWDGTGYILLIGGLPMAAFSLLVLIGQRFPRFIPVGLILAGVVTFIPIQQLRAHVNRQLELGRYQRLVREAQEDLDRRRFEEAISRLQEVEGAGYRELVGPLLMQTRAERAEAEGELERAREFYLEAHARGWEEGAFRAAWLRGIQAERSGDLQTAIEAYRDALERQDNDSLRHALAECRARHLAGEGKWEEALEVAPANGFWIRQLRAGRLVKEKAWLHAVPALEAALSIKREGVVSTDDLQTVRHNRKRLLEKRIWPRSRQDKSRSNWERAVEGFLLLRAFGYDVSGELAEALDGLFPPSRLRELGLEKTDRTGVYLHGATEMEFVYIAPTSYFHEAPPSLVPLVVELSGGFFIGRYEVTREQYRQFCEAKERPMPEPVGSEKVEGADRDRHPVVVPKRGGAASYCRWAGFQLPTFAEWQLAARGWDGRDYPWGDEKPTEELCAWAGHSAFEGRTVAVDRYPGGASPLGCLGMAGNVAEWLADSPMSPKRSRKQLFLTDPTVAAEDRTSWAGGSSQSSEKEIRTSSARSHTYKNPALIGFRVVLDPN